LINTNKNLSKFSEGKKFEWEVNKLFYEKDELFYNNFGRTVGKSPNELKAYSTIDQLQINLGNGKYTVADNVLVKQTGANTFEIIINESKLSETTSFSTNQQYFINNLNDGETTFTTRSSIPRIAKIIPKDSTVIVRTYIKTYQSPNKHINFQVIYNE
jgi:hypothetical protein